MKLIKIRFAPYSSLEAMKAIKELETERIIINELPPLLPLSETLEDTKARARRIIKVKKFGDLTVKLSTPPLTHLNDPGVVNNGTTTCQIH